MKKLFKMKKPFKNKYVLILIGLVIGGTAVWFIKPSNNQMIESSDNHIIESSNNQIWTCSMHPQIRKSEPGNCPICGMELIPLNSQSTSDENPMAVQMSPAAMQLANVQTLILSKQKPVKATHLNGKVKADERKLYSQASHLPGRIEKLMVNFTGESVTKGQTLAYIYSPELVTAQEELFQAYKIKETQPALYQATRGKLLNWKLSEKQIDHILQSGQTQDQFPITADVSGIVLNKMVNLGDYVKKGQAIFEVADLSSVWVLFDVYERDLPWIKSGNSVDFNVQSIPGELFKGKISFIDPYIHPKTRVAQARVEIKNSDNKLKPDMFVSGTVSSTLRNRDAVLMVPKTAVMWTGERSIVYVKEASTKNTNFILREITLGPSLGDRFIVEAGLQEGEEVVTNGAFSIDAAAQLAGKPSMMNPEGGAVMTGHQHGKSASTATSPAEPKGISKAAKTALLRLFEKYLSLKNTLVNNEFDSSKQISASLLKHLKNTPMELFKGDAHQIWMDQSTFMEKSLKKMEKAENIGAIRGPFKELSDAFIVLAKKFGPFDEVLYIQHCPMANSNKGADWISSYQEIRNPYFGSGMLTCGEIISTIK